MTSDDIKKTSKDIADKASNAARDAADEAADAASGLGSRAQDFADQASQAASNLYGQARDQVRDAADKIPGSASDALAAGQQAYATGSKHVAKQVSNQPIEALLLAGAIGFLVGWAANRV